MAGEPRRSAKREPPGEEGCPRAWLTDATASMVESALPLLLLVPLALINLALAGYASVTANNAMNLAARMGSVDQAHPAALPPARGAPGALRGSARGQPERRVAPS